MNSVPYDGRPATTYTAWSNGFGSFTDDKWHPGLSSIPQALATGNFDLRTHCRVVRILTDGDGHASGVEYVDANGNRQIQPARTVILCSYTCTRMCACCCSQATTATPTGWATTPAKSASTNDQDVRRMSTVSSQISIFNRAYRAGGARRGAG